MGGIHDLQPHLALVTYVLLLVPVDPRPTWFPGRAACIPRSGVVVGSQDRDPPERAGLPSLDIARRSWSPPPGRARQHVRRTSATVDERHFARRRSVYAPVPTRLLDLRGPRAEHLDGVAPPPDRDRYDQN